MEFSCMLRFLSYSSFDDCYTKSLLMVKVKCALMNNNEQNGRPHSTERTSPPSDPRPRSSRTQPTPETRKICRDFVWGICSMNEHCKYRHELEYESMKSILKFCHDYQNRLGCTRPDCLYLHASREEENLFLTSGVIPRALVERYASMSIQNDQTSQVLPPQMMYISEYGQPPPPPPPNAQNSYPTPVTLPGPVIGPHMMPPLVGLGHSAQISNNVLPPPISTSKEADQPSRPQMTITVKTNLHTAPIISAAVAPSAPMPAVLTPPPPPPPLPATRTMTSPKTASPISTGAQSLQNSNSPTYPVASTSTTSSVATSSTQQSQPSTSSQLPAIFDPSRPPPPVPVKRPASTEPEAGPSKAMKLDNETSNETRCESCVELNLRIAMEQQEIEQLRLEEERKRRLYEQRTEEYENGNLLLKSMLSPNMFRVVQEFLDKCANTELTASTSNATPQNIPKQFIFQLMEFLISKCNTEQRTPPTETRSSQGMQTMFASIMELLQNGASSSESRVPPIDGAGSNGISRHTNGPVESLPSPARYPSTSTRYPTPSPGAATATPPYVPTNGEVASPGTQFQSEPPPPQHQVPYQAAAPAPVPPPPRPFYQPFANRGPGFPPSTAPPPPIPAGPPPTGPPPTGPQPAGPPPVGAPPAGPPSAGPPPAGPLPAGSSPAARSSQTTQPRPPQSPSYQYNARMPHNYYPPFQ